jgi:5'(3')-deoxyribonucleotidase
MFIVALFHIPKYGSSLVVCPSTDEWIKKMWYIYIYIYIYTHTMEHYSATKKNKTMLFAKKE